MLQARTFNGSGPVVGSLSRQTREFVASDTHKVMFIILFGGFVSIDLDKSRAYMTIIGFSKSNTNLRFLRVGNPPIGFYRDQITLSEKGSHIPGNEGVVSGALSIKQASCTICLIQTMINGSQDLD